MIHLIDSVSSFSRGAIGLYRVSHRVRGLSPVGAHSVAAEGVVVSSIGARRSEGGGRSSTGPSKDSTIVSIYAGAAEVEAVMEWRGGGC
jgi:hypothetical protein